MDKYTPKHCSSYFFTPPKFWDVPTLSLDLTLRKRLISVARHALLILISVAFMLPFYWLVSSALKPNELVFSDPFQWWPNPVRWENFVEAANYPGFPFLWFMWNSIYYSGGVTLGTVLSCALVGYGFARLRFPGRELLFTITISTLMIPAVVTFIPIFLLFKAVGLLGSYAPLILPSFFGYSFFGSAFFIFMMRQFFRGLPTELSDAARVDGAGEFRIFWQIMLPLVVLFLLAQRYFLEGIKFTGLKG